jgi:predicted nucleic acid-binding protein
VIVLDASAALKMVLSHEGSEALVARVVGEDIHAPALIEVEVVSGLRRLQRQRRIAEDRALIGLEWFLDLGIEKHHGPELTRRIFALRNSLSSYDAAYIAVAELIEAPLLTADGRLSRAHGHRARVELF